MRWPRSRSRPAPTVVDEISLTNWYRPDATELAARGLPKAGPRTWVRDPESGAYSRLTKAVRERL